MTTAMGYQTHHHNLMNNFTNTHLLVTSASPPTTTATLHYVSNNHHQVAASINNSNNNHLNNCSTSMAVTTITPTSKPMSAKKPCPSLTSALASVGGLKSVAGTELLRCRRRNTSLRSVAYSTSNSNGSVQPLAVARRNERERNRVKMVNMGFHTLRQHIPNGSKNKKMSKVETLRSAVEYIRRLQLVLNGESSDVSQYSTTNTVMPVDLQPSNSADENVNSSSGSICSPATSSSSPSSMSSYESSQYHHQTSSPTHNNHHLHPSHHHHLSHLHPTLTQCIKLESFMHSPVSSPTSPRSSITSDISPSPYDHHLDVVDKNCTGDDHDIFDFASLLS